MAEKTETVIETVKMTDGRTVDFPGKRKLNVESVEQDGTIALRLDFRNGETRTNVLPKDLLYKAAAHGIEQKTRDEAAGESDIDDYVLVIDDLWARLAKGEWNMKREAGGMSGTSVLIRALVEYTGKSLEEIKAGLVGVSQAEKMALRVFDGPNASGHSLKSIVDRIESEKASKAAKTDVKDIMSKFGVAAPAA